MQNIVIVRWNHGCENIAALEPFTPNLARFFLTFHSYTNFETPSVPFTVVAVVDGQNSIVNNVTCVFNSQARTNCTFFGNPIYIQLLMIFDLTIAIRANMWIEWPYEPRTSTMLAFLWHLRRTTELWGFHVCEEIRTFEWSFSLELKKVVPFSDHGECLPEPIGRSSASSCGICWSHHR